MRSRSIAVAALMLGTGALHAQSAPPPAPALPGWMAGCWLEEKASAWTEECWTAPRAGTMLGSGRNGRGNVLGSWETMQILTEAGGKLAYVSAPGGVGRTRFALASASATEAVFVNAQHDYPQRIRYWREGAMLGAEISLADGSKPMRWMYKRLG